jgi:hypothetical protein
LRRDWEFLIDQLRSTYAVVEYLRRVERSAAHLGEEPDRYYELAAADAEAEPTELDPGVPGAGVPHSSPMFPVHPAGSDDDAAHGMVRIICEDIANTDSETSEEDRLKLLAAIDSLPVGHRSSLGRYLLHGLSDTLGAPRGTSSWKFRTVRAPLDRAQLGFGVCSKFDESIRAEFTSWLLLRHHERGATGSLTDVLSLGVLLTPRADGLRDWDTTLAAVMGDPNLSEEELAASRKLWGRANAR